MAEIRFPLRGRHARRNSEPEPAANEAAPESPEIAADPLAEMAAQIRELDAAAERAATRIEAAAESLREGQLAEGSATRTDLLAGLGAALVDRTQEIRADCERLSALMERTANLIAERDTAEAAPESTPAPEAPTAEALDHEEGTPGLATELGSLLPEPAPLPDLEPEPLPEPEATAEPEPQAQPPAAPVGDDPASKPRWLARQSEEAQPAHGTSEGVRLIATQMAIAGSSRTEIERRLRIQFGVRDADQALDEIFRHPAQRSELTMADTAPESPSSGLGASSELRRSVGQATERIHEIIDAAERVALEVRADAEREAEAYLAERNREADRLVSERTASLDELTRKLTDSAERFKRQAEQTLGELDAVIAEARAGLDRSGPVLAREPELRPVEPREPAPAPEPAQAPEPEGAVLSAYQGGASEADETAEALLRATQLAVTGKGRDEIVAVLRSDFPSVDAESIADEILG